MKIRTALIGLGRIAWEFHLPELSRHHAFALEAVADPLPERVADTRERFRVPRGYRSLAELLAAETPQLVVIASPTCCHKEQILQAFAAGCDVFCDKPLALSAEEVREIAAASRRLNRKIITYQPHRLMPEALTLRRILEENLLGRIFLVHRVWARYQRRDDWQAFRANGGGMLNNYGSHFIDQYFSLFGTSLARRHIETRRLVSGGDAEDMVKAQLVRPDGLIFDLEINMAAAFDSSAWELHGARGGARLHPAERRWELRTLTGLPPLRIGRELAAAGRRYPSERLDWRTRDFSFADQPPGPFYDRVAGYLAGTEPSPVPLSDTLALLELLDFARSSSPAGESVKEMSYESLPAALQSRPPSSVRSGPML